jgi:hypothetical protein
MTLININIANIISDNRFDIFELLKPYINVKIIYNVAILEIDVNIDNICYDGNVDLLIDILNYSDGFILDQSYADYAVLGEHIEMLRYLFDVHQLCVSEEGFNEAYENEMFEIINYLENECQLTFANYK